MLKNAKIWCFENNIFTSTRKHVTYDQAFSLLNGFMITVNIPSKSGSTSNESCLLLCKDWIHRSLLFPATWAAQLLLSQCLPTWQSFKKGSHFLVWHFLIIGFVYFVKPSFTASLSCGCVHGFGGNGLSKAGCLWKSEIWHVIFRYKLKQTVI